MKWGKIICPMCGLINVTKFLYGILSYSKRLEKEPGRKRLILAGSIKTDASRDFFEIITH